jgi:ABC-type Fe3+-hydroxamate transport system substrate-binding protein
MMSQCPYLSGLWPVLALALALACGPAQAAELQMDASGRLIDQGGRQIRVKRPFARIISLYGAHTENLFSLGLGNEIIGVAPHEDFPAEAMEKPVFSYHDDPEKFLAARPDLVLVRPMIDRGYPQLLGRLEKSGIVVVSMQPTTVRDMFRYWEALGRLTGREHEARHMTGRFQGALAAFRSLTRGQEPKKRVYFEAIHSRMRTFSPDAMAMFALEAAGGINVAAGARARRGTNIADFGKERILSHAEDMDVYLAQYGTMNRPTVAMIRNSPGFSILKAVRNGEIHIVDERIVSRPTLRMLNGIYEIGKILYPKRFGKPAREILVNAGRDIGESSD